MTLQSNGAGMGVRRTPVQPPDWRALAPEVCAALARRADLAAIRTLGVMDVAGLPADRFLPFHHPLSDAFVEANGPARAVAHVAEEQAVLAHFTEQPLVLAKPADLAEQLMAAASIATGREMRLRTGDAGLSPNATGRRVMFPACDVIRPILADVQAKLDAMPVGLMRATATMVMILNVHPFADGNGRVARGVFNHLIVGMGCRGYFPLSAIIARSRGGFELAVRSAELKADWNPIMRYVLAALALGDAQPGSTAGVASARSTLLSR